MNPLSLKRPRIAMLEGGGCVVALGTVTGNQAMQMVLAGLELIYLSGWQVVADADTVGTGDIDWFLPIDADAGFGGSLNAFEIIKAYIEAGAAGVHFENQLASEKKCGNIGGKVLIPTQAHIRNLNAASWPRTPCRERQTDHLGQR